MKKTTLQVQMKGIGNLAVRMSDFHMLNIRNSSMHFIEQQTGKLEMCVLNIHDTINALDYYVSQKKVMHQGERYLLICGAFQSLFIQ